MTGPGIEKKRTITIDPSMYSMSNKTKRNAHSSSNKSKPTTIKPRPFIRPNTLKKTLLEKIKQHQQRKYKHSADHHPTNSVSSDAAVAASAAADSDQTRSADNSFSNSFNDSLSYLQSLSNNRQTAKRKNKGKFTPTTPVLTTQQAQQSQQAQQAQQAPALVESLPLLPLSHLGPEVNVELPPAFSDNTNTTTSGIILNREPVWGCLKYGTKPTFRTLNNTTLKSTPASFGPPAAAITPIANDAPASDPAPATPSASAEESSIPPINETTDDADMNEIRTATNSAIDNMYGTRKQRLDEYKREHLTNAKNQQPILKIRETRQHVITKKYKLGKYVNKNGPVIGVLIKNRQTQYNIEKKRNEMKHIPLHTIKTRLHKKNLLKVGSIAPPDVLRELYETAVFAGDIEYENEGTLLHNFLTSSESTPENDSGSSSS